MLKNFVVLFFLVTISADTLLDSLTLFLSESGVPERVRTIEERSKNDNGSILDFIGLVEQYEGYTAEEYKVPTDDGYILILHRITNSPMSHKRDGKPVVFLQHGVTGSSDLWVLPGPNVSLGFQLADAGFDVWLGNSRGNAYSRFHYKYSPTQDLNDFWNFGMDELGLFDMSAFIDFTLNKTNQKNLTYIGYSMGSTLIYILLSSKPEYNNKVNLLVSLSPVVFFTQRPYYFLEFMLTSITTLAKIKNIYEMFPSSNNNIKLAREICGNITTQENCKDLLKMVSDVENLDLFSMSMILPYFPAGTSFRVMEHLNQVVKSGKLQKYDYGCIFFYCLNNIFYNQTEPPEYNVSRITVPNAILYSDDDVFVNPKDVEYLRSLLPNVLEFIKISNAKFNHMDFIWSSSVNNLVNNQILNIMNSSSMANSIISNF